MEKTNEDNESIRCEGALAPDLSETLMFNEPNDDEKSQNCGNVLEQETASLNIVISDTISSMSVDFSTIPKSSISPTKRRSSESPKTSDLIESFERIELFDTHSSKQLDSLETSKLSKPLVNPKLSETSMSSMVCEPSVKSKLSETYVRSKLSESSETSKLPESSVRSKLPESSVRSKLPESSVRSKLPESSVRSKLPESSGRSKLFESSVKSKLAGSSVRSKLPGSSVHSEPTVRAKFSEPFQKAKSSKPSLKSKLSKLLVKFKILKPFAKYKLSSSVTSAESCEISKLSDSGEQSQSSDSFVDFPSYESNIQSQLSAPSVQSHLCEPSVRTKSIDSSKSSKSKFYGFFETSKRLESSTAKSRGRKLNKALNKSLELRRSFMIDLYENILKVKGFIDEVETFKPPYQKRNVGHACCSNPRDAAEWANLHSYWDSLKEHINKLIVRIQVIYLDSHKCISLTVEEFQDFVELLIYVFIDIGEMCEICQNGLDKYRRFCFYYNEYLFLVYASTFNNLVSSLREKLRVELCEFKILEEKVLGLK